LAPFAEGRTNVLLVGDSYGQDWANAMDAHGVWDRVSLSTYHIDAFCGNLWPEESIEHLVVESGQAHCSRHLKYDDPVLQERIAEADWILLVSSWDFWHVPYLPETVNRLEKVTQGKVRVVGAKSFGQLSTRDYREFLQIPLEERLQLRTQPKDKVVDADRAVKQVLNPVNYVSMFDPICGGDTSCPLFTPEGALISFDGGHFTPEGARLAGKLILEKAPLEFMHTVPPNP